MSIAHDEAATLPLYEIIYRVLRQHIAERRFPNGLVLGESAIARAFNTSRIPAAAALKRLREEGLVADFGGKGYLARGHGRADGPVRITLDEAGLVVPPEVRNGASARNHGDRIYPDVEHAVASCLAHGRFMVNESALAEHYGVSRAIAHEVLTKLERAGIATRDSNQRWYAGPLTADHIREHFEIRWILEPVALTQAAPKLDPKDLREKRERILGVGDGRKRPSVFERIERDLHIDVVDRCDNSLIRDTVRRSQLILIATHTTFHRQQNPGEMVTMANEHRAIFDHLIAGRVPQAAAALEAHLRRSLEPNIELVRTLGPLPTDAYPPYLVQEG